MNKTRPAIESDLTAVVPLHATHLPPGFLLDLGPSIIHSFYLSALRLPEVIFIVAETDGQVAGFVFGSLRGGSIFNKIVLGSPLKWILLLVRCGLQSPLVFLELLKMIFSPGDKRIKDGPELTYLVVDPRFQKSGFGRSLVAAFNSELLKKGHSSYELSSLVENKSANSFYERLGFKTLFTYTEGKFNRVRMRIDSF